MGFTKPLMDLKLYGDKELNTCSNTSVREQLSSRGAMKSMVQLLGSNYSDCFM